MFESLRNRWPPHQLAIAGLCAVVVIAMLLGEAANMWFSSEQVAHGVVVSVGSVGLAGACGGTHAVASVRLSNGRVINAVVVAGGPVSQGAQVTVRQHSFLCNPAAYEVVARR